jgi:glycosyltransferase involved in cell wall biosynthesis
VHESLAVVAWTTLTARAEELARGFGGTGVRFGNLGLRSPASGPLRYLVNALRTVAWLARHRPRTLVVQNPPIVLAVIAAGWARATGGRFVLDSHPVSFGRKENRLWGAFVPLHRVLARRAALVLVTVDELADEVRSWGGRAVVVHEAPPADQLRPERETRPASARPLVLFVAVYADDEPVEEVVAAAERVPDVDFEITGRLDLAAGRLPERLPANVRLVGFLGPDEYGRALDRADVVLALTTEPTSVVRAGYEAVYAGRPLVVSDWPSLRSLFPYAVPGENSIDGIAAAVRRALREHERLTAAAGAARQLQAERWSRQVADVRTALAA